jgi:hypothetical protein
MQTIADRIAEFRITSDYVMTDGPMPNGFDPNGYAYRVTLRIGVMRRQGTFSFYTGSNVSEPDTATVLDCLISDAASYYNCTGYADFCEDFGYEQDNESHRIYQACKRTFNRLEIMFGTRNVLALIHDTERL